MVKCQTSSDPVRDQPEMTPYMVNFCDKFDFICDQKLLLFFQGFPSRLAVWQNVNLKALKKVL